MPPWRPPDRIAVKVIGLAFRAGSWLMLEVESDDGSVKGVRPLGGSVHLGDSRERALHREFSEELNTSIVISGGWHVFENLFEHEGSPGHEIVFAVAVSLTDLSLYGRDTIPFVEDNGDRCRARWVGSEEIANGLPVFPNGLSSLLLATTGAGAEP